MGDDDSKIVRAVRSKWEATDGSRFRHIYVVGGNANFRLLLNNPTRHPSSASCPRAYRSDKNDADGES